MADIKEIESAIEWLKENLPPIEDYGEMVGAPAQYCGTTYVYNDPCGYVFETAIETLQHEKERIECKKGCEYCNDLVSLYEDNEGYIDIDKDSQELNIVYRSNGWDGGCYDKSININFCPICGRDLRQPKEG